MEIWAVCVLLMAAASDGDATRELDRAIAAIRNQEENSQSFTLEYTYQDRSRMFIDPQREEKSERTVRLFGDGIKRRHEEILPGGTFDERSDYYEIRAFNGEKQFAYSPKQHSGGFGTGRRMRFPVTYFDFLHGFPTGLGAVLQENRAQIRASIVDIEGESLLQLSFAVKNRGEVRLWLNPKAAYQIRRLETRGKAESYFGTIVITRDTRVAQYIQKGSFFFPSGFVTTWTSQRKDGTTHTDDEMHVRLLSVDPSAKHDPGLFEIAFPKGTRVVDADSRSQAIAGVPGSARPLPPDADSLLRSQARDAGVWRTVGICGCSAGLLGAMFLFWWRRHKTQLPASRHDTETTT